jgi:hypothetical protein
MGTIGIEDEPAALHFRVAKRLAAPARHLIRCDRQVHMLGRIAIEVEYSERAVTGRE